MNNQDNIQRLKEEILDSRIDRQTDENEDNRIICDGSHSQDKYIREGNRLYAIIIKDDKSDKLSIESVTCTDCNIQNLVDKNVAEYNKGDLCVAECTYIINEKGDKVFDNINVWEYISLEDTV